ncbi:hypothetical protein LIER_34495 [Lithospermum erythrorhizon]|uniref:Uncharacterized protein n=1 Tax=Lithospermum erythrorhizon TaxID=34254 RepID=A0AAV3S135_LITER
MPKSFSSTAIGLIPKKDESHGFLWSSTTEKKSSHWASWQKVCYPYQKGGLKVQKLQDTQNAFTGNLWWRFITTKSMWSRLLSATYIRGKNIYTLQAREYDSRQWKRLLQRRNIAN